VDISQTRLGIVHVGVWLAATSKRFSDEITPEVPILYVCDDTIQTDFIAAGPGNIPSHLYLRIANHVRALQQSGCDLVMVGCSTMSRAPEYVRPLVDVPVLPIDLPMMQKAVTIGRRIGLMCTIGTTVPSSTLQLTSAAAAAGKEIDIVLRVRPDAIELAKAGNRLGHDQIVLDEVRKLATEVDVVVLAQLSMAELESQMASMPVPVLNSGREGFNRAREMLLEIAASR
jgi:glutamate racemase